MRMGKIILTMVLVGSIVIFIIGLILTSAPNFFLLRKTIGFFFIFTGILTPPGLFIILSLGGYLYTMPLKRNLIIGGVLLVSVFIVLFPGIKFFPEYTGLYTIIPEILVF